MAKCKECYHYLVCKFLDNDDKECSQFKDRMKCAEVVRCKDCQFLDTEGCPMKGISWDVQLDDFCSYGERRGDEVN